MVNDRSFNFHQHARYMGRMDWRNPLGPVLTWAGSSITARFTGTSITMRMKQWELDEVWLDVIIDGQTAPKIRISADCDTYLLADALDEGEHLVEVYKRVEAMFGTVQFLGFILNENGQFLDPPPHLARKIEIIGDSISAGSGNEGKDGDPNIAEHENNALAYGTLAAHRLQAEHHTIAVSGIGLLVNYGDERENTMPDQYDRLDPLHVEPTWDFTLWQPDVVVINLGTNDSSYEVSHDEFVTRYEHFVRQIRLNYPRAHITMSLGPFAQVPMKDFIWDAYNNLRASGDSRVHYLLFDKADIDQDGLGETGHPNTITHSKMADQLVTEIQRFLPW